MPEPDDRSDYLGDGVYAWFDGYQTWIWTSNGITDSDRIAIDDATLRSLNNFHKRMKEDR